NNNSNNNNNHHHYHHHYIITTNAKNNQYHHNNINIDHDHPHTTTTTIDNNNNNNNRQNNKTNNNNYYYTNNKIKQPNTHNTQEQNNYKTTEYYNRHVSKEKLHYLPSKSLISYYPHLLRHKQEFFRKIAISIELDDKKEDIFHLSNIYYQTEYFKLESEKWKIYMSAANKKRPTEQMDTIMEIDDSLPVARMSPTGLARQPTPLDLTQFAEIFEEWLPQLTPGQKRKLGHRRDDPPTSPSPRQPPPIIPRKTLPPRDPNALLIGGSLRSSPISNTENNHKKQHLFNSLLPLERKKENEQQIQISDEVRTSNVHRQAIHLALD
ncbi:unnamed protein product, partial [Rotaria sp. Silwood2]